MQRATVRRQASPPNRSYSEFSEILGVADDDGAPLVEKILDTAGQHCVVAWQGAPRAYTLCGGVSHRGVHQVAAACQKHRVRGTGRRAGRSVGLPSSVQHRGYGFWASWSACVERPGGRGWQVSECERLRSRSPLWRGGRSDSAPFRTDCIHEPRDHVMLPRSCSRGKGARHFGVV